jgi:hypothetical protein
MNAKLFLVIASITAGVGCGGKSPSEAESSGALSDHLSDPGTIAFTVEAVQPCTASSCASIRLQPASRFGVTCADGKRAKVCSVKSLDLGAFGANAAKILAAVSDSRLDAPHVVFDVPNATGHLDEPMTDPFVPARAWLAADARPVDVDARGLMFITPRGAGCTPSDRAYTIRFLTDGSARSGSFFATTQDLAFTKGDECNPEIGVVGIGNVSGTDWEAFAIRADLANVFRLVR